jgi:Zn-finger nucleic acid-binding protein
MRARVGPHLEDECPSCGGTFFEGGIAAAVLQERFGLTPAAVVAAADASGAGGPCPACARPLRPVLLDEVIGDVCVGCGGVWLDAGERETLLPT